MPGLTTVARPLASISRDRPPVVVLNFARRLPFLALHLALRGLPSHGETDAHLLVHGAVVILALRGVLTGHPDTVGPEGLLVRVVVQSISMPDVVPQQAEAVR